MTRHLVRSLCFAALATALVLQGCGKSSPVDSGRGNSRSASGRTAQPASLAFRSAALHGQTTSRNPGVASTPGEQYQTDDPPPWLAELLRSPDPNVRIQALDAWAQHPGASLDPVTYALIDPDESVRARAQEVLEQELVRR
jgi:hypothetical protein